MKPLRITKAQLLIIAVAFALLMAWLNIASYLFFPNVSLLKKHTPETSAFIEYRLREAKMAGKNIEVHRVWVPLRQISPYLQKAVIIAEDDKFWSHEGFDFEAMREALGKDIKRRKFKFGGSTISQQLVKNLYLSPSKSVTRKLKEAILTWRIERSIPKRRILELYLNFAEWGNGVFGAEAAARHYFGKSASALHPEEAARLATVLPNPHRLNPVGESRYVERRSRIIYKIMVRRGIVTPEYELIDEEGHDPANPEKGLTPLIEEEAPPVLSPESGYPRDENTPPDPAENSDK